VFFLTCFAGGIATKSYYPSFICTLWF